MDDFKWIDPKDLVIYKCTCNSLRGCALEVDLEYLKKLRQLHNDYNLAPNKVEITEDIFSKDLFMIVYFYNIPVGNVKKFAPRIFCKKKYVLHYENLQIFLRLGLKLNKNNVLQFN